MDGFARGKNIHQTLPYLINIYRCWTSWFEPSHWSRRL